MLSVSPTSVADVSFFPAFFPSFRVVCRGTSSTSLWPPPCLSSWLTCASASQSCAPPTGDSEPEALLHGASADREEVLHPLGSLRGRLSRGGEGRSRGLVFKEGSVHIRVPTRTENENPELTGHTGPKSWTTGSKN